MTTHLTAAADQLAAHLRDARCCDPFEPCDDCRVKRTVHAEVRHAARVPAHWLEVEDSETSDSDWRQVMQARSAKWGES